MADSADTVWQIRHGNPGRRLFALLVAIGSKQEEGYSLFGVDRLAVLLYTKSDVRVAKGEIKMNDVISSPPAPQTAADYEAELEEMWMEIERLNALIKSDQADIDRLKAESDAIRAETEIIKARTQARLDSLARMMQ